MSDRTAIADAPSRGTKLVHRPTGDLYSVIRTGPGGLLLLRSRHGDYQEIHRDDVGITHMNREWLLAQREG